MAADQIGVTGKAGYWGIPATTLAWNNGTARSMTIFTEISKKPMADIDPTLDNAGERLGQNRRNKRIQLTFSAHAKGAAASDAQAIAADLPYPGDKCTVTAASDAQAACDNSTDTLIVDDASARWTPEGELVVDVTATKWIGKVYVALS